ncbi:MAG: hypothetical protein KAV00_15350 [Phycisphaerae bacterium]|nr:hypothetical protein [Phycisphaerae bacterium]
MISKPTEIDAPQLALNSCSVEEHCRALCRIKKLPFWWHQGTSKMFGNFSVPFCDANGVWWYQVKPGLCWMVECFRPLDPAQVSLPFRKAFLGYQHVVANEAAADSHLCINSIRNLSNYGSGSLSKNRRKVIRRGIKNCQFEIFESHNVDLLSGCHVAWNDLTTRTGWRHAVNKDTFTETWQMASECPGVSIIIGRDKQSGEVVGFLSTKIIGDTAHGDTIACRTDKLDSNFNDAIIYAFLINAGRIPGVTKVNYAIQSHVKALERFKAGMGFEAYPYPARTHLRWGIGSALRLFFPDKYNRMTGRFDRKKESTSGDD